MQHKHVFICLFFYSLELVKKCFSPCRGFSQNRDWVQKIQNWPQFNTNLLIRESFQPFRAQLLHVDACRAQLFEHRHVFAIFAVVVVFFKNFLLLGRVRRRLARRTQLHRYHAMVAAKTFVRIYFALL